MTDTINTFLSTYELGKVVGAKEEQIRIIQMVKKMATTEDEIGPFVYVSDFIEYLEDDNDQPTH